MTVSGGFLNFSMGAFIRTPRNCSDKASFNKNTEVGNKKISNLKNDRVFFFLNFEGDITSV